MVQLVGILNVTPDSFSDGGQFLDAERAVEHAKQLFAAGAALVDVGAESTRPQATALSDDEEWQRLEPVLRSLLAAYPGKLSLDSYHPETIARAFAIGPVIVNDVTGFHDPQMVRVVAGHAAKVVVSHLPNMSIQEAHQQVPVSRVEQVKEKLLHQAAVLERAGIKHGDIILDPGIGFGKTMELNKELLCFAEQVPDYPVMIGYSRKRFLGEDRMEIGPNLAAGRVAIAHGAAYLRVHDVTSHADLLREL